MLASEYDVIALSETWLASDIFDSELFNDRYVVYRRDRDSSFFHTKKYGGGVLLAVSKCLNSCRLTYYESKCEDVWISVDIRVNNKLEKLSICCVYIPSPVQKHVLEHFLDSANQAMETSKLTLILGDFNLGNIEWTGSPGLPLLATLPQNSLYATMLTDFITLNNLDQYNHVKNHNSKILDLVLTNIPVSCLRACDSPLSKVDAHHPPLEFQLSSCTSTLTLSSREEPRYKFYKGDYCKIIEELKVISWHDVFKQCSDVDSMVQLLYDKINNIIRKHIPKSKNSTRKYPCWYSRDLISLLREKNKYQRTCKLIHSDYKKYISSIESLNADKCNFVHFSRKKSPYFKSYVINNHAINEVDVIKDLGVHIDNKLRFHTHVDLLAKRSYKLLGFVLRNCREFRSASSKIAVFNTLVRSGLEYCSVVWNPHYEVHKKRLEAVQKRFLWHLSYQCNLVKRLPTYNSRLKYFKMTSLESRRNMMDYLFLFKLVNNSLDCPDLLKQINLNGKQSAKRIHKDKHC
ncbi:hypothetical protein ABMA28_000634 [Loxostege sticticalis]|uniref:Endonuclease/exonuclease/phosphatase domain-containing protein n=1 Tax=Loxostege sticticalis TaxID=481309 RepID=A0ABD0TT52_LOXSC